MPRKKKIRKSHNSSKLKRWFSNYRNDKHPITKFIVAFCVGIILFYILYSSTFYEQRISPPLINFQANLSSFIIDLFGFNTSINGDMISANNEEHMLSIRKGCDGIEPIALFIIGVLLVPFQINTKLYGILFGISALFILNLFRIVGLFLVNVYAPSLFEPLHIHGGYAIFLIVTILLWIGWARWAIQYQNS